MDRTAKIYVRHDVGSREGGVTNMSLSKSAYYIYVNFAPVAKGDTR